jgi:carboxyl-terminal processing protease
MGIEQQANNDALPPSQGQDSHAQDMPPQTQSLSLPAQAWNLLHFRAPNACEPSAEYEQYLETAAGELYAPQRLGDITKLEHKFDCQIHSVDDAVKYANIALGVVDDPYTKVMSPKDVQTERQQSAGETSSIGVVAFNHGPADANEQTHAPLFIDEVYPGSPADKAGIKAGDKILQIQGQNTSDLSPHQSWALIEGAAGTSVNLEIQHGAQLQRKDVVREKVNTPVVEDKDLGHDIAYLKLSDFMADSGPAAMKAALNKHSNAKAFVIDMRNNLGGAVNHALAISALFIKEGGITTIRSREVPELTFRDNWDEKSRLAKLSASPSFYTDEISLTGQKAVQTINGKTSTSDRPPYMIDGKPVVVLTNGYTASAGEMFTGAVHDSGHATVIGERTYGKGIGQTYLIDGMPNGTGEKVTSLRYFTPSGLWPGDAYKHRIGLAPDIEVHNPVDAIPGSADDLQLNTAVTFLTKKLGGK